MEFRDLFELAMRATRCKMILLDEQEMTNSSKGIYYKDPNYDVHMVKCNFDIGKVDIAKIIYKRPIVCTTLSKLENNNIVIKQQTFEADTTYMLDITKADQIFYTLLGEKVIRLGEGPRIPKADDLKGKKYYK